MTVHPDIIEHILNARHELNIEIFHYKIHTFNYGAFVVLEILLALISGSWLYLIPCALFLILWILFIVRLFQTANSRQSIDKAISLLISMEDEETEKEEIK